MSKILKGENLMLFADGKSIAFPFHLPTDPHVR